MATHGARFAWLLHMHDACRVVESRCRCGPLAHWQSTRMISHITALYPSLRIPTCHPLPRFHNARPLHHRIHPACRVVAKPLRGKQPFSDDPLGIRA